MARPQKQTVDYFPHDTDASDGKTLTIIQSKYGNNGFAFWFKLLQLLGKTPGHYYDYNNPVELEFLCAKTHQKDTETILAMLNTLADLKAIDYELHKAKVIWIQNFVNGIADAYKRTKDGVPQRPVFLINVGKYGDSVSILDQTVNNMITKTIKNDTEMPQTKLKEIKLNKTKILNVHFFDKFWNAYPRKVKRLSTEKAFIKINPNEELLIIILNSIEKFKKTEEWKKENGKYIPHPASWLNDKRWEDEDVNIIKEKGDSSYDGDDL